MSSILLRPHPTDVTAPLLPATSHIRVQVEQTRFELLKWIGKLWLGIRQEREFGIERDRTFFFPPKKIITFLLFYFLKILKFLSMTFSIHSLKLEIHRKEQDDE